MMAVPIAACSPVLSAVRCVTLPQKKNCEYKFYTEFQSHEPEFDYLKSLEIEEKINKIKWCKRQNAAHFLLSTNGASSVSHSVLSPLPSAVSPSRQDNQAMESVRKAAASSVGEQPGRWPEIITRAHVHTTSQIASDDATGQYYCRRTTQGLL